MSDRHCSEDVDAATAAALLGHGGDAAVVAKLRAILNSVEGVVVGAFARVASDDGVGGDGGEVPISSEQTVSGGGGDALKGIFAMGFDVFAGESFVDGGACRCCLPVRIARPVTGCH